jgi:hypothetical protein
MKRLIKQVLKEETNEIDYVWYFYDKFLNRQPIEFHGLILEPIYDKKDGVIIWDVANPNDYSFNYNILYNVIRDEFKSFANIMNIDLMFYRDFIVKFWHKPRFNCYIGKQDKKEVEKILTSKTEINFKSDEIEFDINCRYKKFRVYPTGDHTEIEVDYDFLKIKKITYPEKTVDVISKEQFFSFLYTEGSVYDDYLDFLYDDLLQHVMSVFASNVRFFNPQIDWFDLSLK